MINTLGPFLLILTYSQGGIAIQEMSSFEACRTAVVQLEVLSTVRGYCIAKDLQ